MAKQGALDSIIAAQREKNPSLNASKESIESALSGKDTISIADFKKILAGETLEAAPKESVAASNVTEIADNIKVIAENSEVEKSVAKDMIEVQEKLALTPEEKKEQIEVAKEQVDVLKSIEENTRATTDSAPKEENKPEESKGGFLSGLLGFLGGALSGGIAGLFAGGVAGAGGGILSALVGGIKTFIITAFKALLKGAIITMLVGGLINGILDGLEEYKKSGSITEALWAGLAGFIEFLSFGLIDKEDLDAFSDLVKEQWDSLKKTILDWIDSMTPDFLKEKKTESSTAVSPVTRITAHDGEKLSELDISHTKSLGDGKKEDVRITGSETKNTAGENIFEVKVNGKDYRITKETYNLAKEAADSGNKARAVNIIEKNHVQEDADIKKVDPAKRVGDIKINEDAQMNFDSNGMPINLGTPEQTTADAVIKQTEDNLASKEASTTSSAPIVVNAPTSNTVSSHTTSTAPLRATMDGPRLTDTYSLLY